MRRKWKEGEERRGKRKNETKRVGRRERKSTQIEEMEGVGKICYFTLLLSIIN